MRRASRDGLWLHAARPLFRAGRGIAAYGRPATCRIRTGPEATPVAPVGGYVLGIPAQPSPRAGRRTPSRRSSSSPRRERRSSTSKTAAAPIRATRSAPTPRCAACRHLRGRRPDVLARRASVLATPANPEISKIIQICGEELHDMLRGIITPRDRIAPPRSGPSKPCGSKPVLKTGRSDMDPNRLKGKNILITGAARGMGAANAEASPRRAPMSAWAIWTRRSAGGRRPHQRGRQRQGGRREDGCHQARGQRGRGRRNGRGLRLDQCRCLQRRPEQAPVLHGYR
jgi:hypothetical protein